MRLSSGLAGLWSKCHCHRTGPTMTDSFAVWKLPSTFNSGGNRSKTIYCSGFLLPSIFQDASHAVILVFKSMIKPYAQWEEIPLHFVQCVLVPEGQLGMLWLSQVGVVLCGSHAAAQGMVAGSGSCHQRTHSEHAHQELNIDSEQVLHHQTHFCFSRCPMKPKAQIPECTYQHFLLQRKVQFCSEKEL